MTYLIPAVLLIFIIALIIFFRSAKKKKVEDIEVPAEPGRDEISEEPVVSPVSEAGEAVRLEAETGPERDKAEIQPVAEAEPVKLPPEEEFVELSFESEVKTAVEEKAGEDEFIELSLDMEEKESGEAEAVGAVAMEDEGDLQVTPALADSTEESEIAVEEAPAELEEKLDYYFGEEEQPAPAGEAEAEAETGAAEEEILLEESLGEPAVSAEVPVEEIEESAVPARLTKEGYESGLRSLEAELRQDLQEAIEQKDSGQRTVLESKLQAVCEKMASIEETFGRQRRLIEEAGKIVVEVQNEARQKELPGIDIEETENNLQLGNYTEVESILGEAILQLDNESELVAKVYYVCGQLAEERLDYESAFEDYRNAVAADEENGSYLVAAGRIARILGNDGDAHQWLENVVRHGLEQSEQSLLQAEAQHELARVCMREGQKEKAGALFNRALEIRERVLGSEHPDLGPLLHDYAVLFESNGMYEQAEELYTRALAVMEKNLGDSHPRLAATLNKLAGLYEELEIGDKSLPLYEKALAIREQVLGREHYDVGTILNSLADLLRRRGKLEKAEPMFKRSLAIAEKELGPDHPNLTVILNNLAELYSQMGREDEAARYQERAFSLFELPGMDGDFVEMEKDRAAGDDDKNTTIAGK